MSKRRKTRQQKIIADLRRKIQSTDSAPSQETMRETIERATERRYTLPQKTTDSPSVTTLSARSEIHAIPQNPYLMRDLTRTAVLTSALILTQLALFAALKNHLITIPFVSY